MGKQRKFGGKIFNRDGVERLKPAANERAYILRLTGWNVRLVKVKGGWAIYKRKGWYEMPMTKTEAKQLRSYEKRAKMIERDTKALARDVKKFMVKQAKKS